MLDLPDHDGQGTVPEMNDIVRLESCMTITHHLPIIYMMLVFTEHDGMSGSQYMSDSSCCTTPRLCSMTC